ncbi:AMP-binding protein [Humitalea sp. 24SJ18S-53]|uniref:AMP-binding protein n=1 Tax=Humitalea sp. 24SJ18S-53 TaxID=3422307 RepID=UPI003D678EEF
MTEIWAPLRISDLLDRNATHFPAAEALVAGPVRLSHAGLRDEARAMARSLLALGLRRGDAVGLLFANTAEWVVGFYAAGLIGCISVPLNTRWRANEIAHALRRADCRALLMADRFLRQDFVALLAEAEPALLTALPGTALPLLRHVVVTGTDVPAAALPMGAFRAAAATEAELEAAIAAVTDQDALLVQFTSGTTAFPKGVLLSHQNMIRNASACALRLGVRDTDRYLNCRPFFHVAGSTLSLLVCAVTGACLVTPPTFEAGEALRLLATEQCTVTSGNDSIFQLMLTHPDFIRDRLHLRAGWAAAGPQTMRRIVDDLGIRDLAWAYGLSEASPNVVLSDYREPLDLRIAGLALPHPGIEIRIADPDTLAPVPAERRGEIQVRGWSVMLGYVNDPEATARAITADGWLRTGDLGSLTTDGRLHLSGRLKDVLRVGGENVAPAEVEEALLAHPMIAMAQVVGVPDARLGEVPVAFVRATDGALLDPAAVLDWLRPRIANFRLPRRLWLVEDFETIGMTASGKVQKGQLRTEALARMGAEAPAA